MNQNVLIFALAVLGVYGVVVTILFLLAKKTLNQLAQSSNKSVPLLDKETVVLIGLGLAAAVTYYLKEKKDED